MDCGFAVESSAVGCDFPGGQSPRAAFFLDSQVSDEFDVPFVTADKADPVVDVEDRELTEDEEFVRCTPFRGMNILPTSSWLIAPRPFWPLAVLHPILDEGWTGAATAVITRSTV